jgi:hypothetical protein
MQEGNGKWSVCTDLDNEEQQSLFKEYKEAKTESERWKVFKKYYKVDEMANSYNEAMEIAIKRVQQLLDNGEITTGKRCVVNFLAFPCGVELERNKKQKSPYKKRGRKAELYSFDDLKLLARNG